MIVRTTDGGQSWESHANLGFSFSDVSMVDSLTATAVGGEGVIVRTTDGGVTWIPEQRELPRSLLLEQNYPNPFNPVTTITYVLDHPQSVTLVVTDLYGREQRRMLDNCYQEAGTHRELFDAEGLSSGVYLYSLSSGNHRETRRMLLLR
jgi:hypothetical protein